MAATPLRKLDSAAVLERQDSSTSSLAYVRQDTVSPSVFLGAEERGQDALAPIAIDLAIRFGRLGVVSACALRLVATLTVVLNRGVVLGHLDPATTTADAQKQRVDDFNSYPGNAAAFFGKPIELFVALAVQLVLLRALSAAVMRAQPSWKLDALALVLSAGVWLPAQQQPQRAQRAGATAEIEPKISATDLAYAPELGFANAMARSTNLTNTFSERSPRNPITSTALRNLVLPRVAITKPYCNWSNSQDLVYSATFPDLVLEYGFSQRDWQGRLLSEALTAKQLRMVVNATSQSAATAPTTTNPDDLPMNTSLAADLFLYGMFISPNVFPWPRETSFLDIAYMQRRYPDGNVSGPAARVTGLLPPLATPALDETAQREWFLRESKAALMRQLSNATNTSRSDVVIEYSHVDISPTLRFDGVTNELEVEPARVANETKNSTRFNYVEPAFHCGPWPIRCMMRKPLLTPPTNEAAYDLPAQVQVFAPCVNADGAEVVTIKSLSVEENPFDCKYVSNTSLMVMSVGKRFVADSTAQDEATGVGTVTNMRRIFTYTVGRLSWDLTDLSNAFNAKCTLGVGSCHGLRFPLGSTGATNQRQEIIVGVDALPTRQMIPMTSPMNPRYAPLVKLHEPSSKPVELPSRYDAFAGDPLPPHNMGNVTWGAEMMKDDVCSSFIEERLQLILSNHMYIEHGLQTAYTAATFFLFQNGVVKDVVELNDASDRLSLNFQLNTQRVALLVSIPDQNARLTLVGCGLLLVSLGIVAAWAWATSPKSGARTSGGLGLVTTPHVVTRARSVCIQVRPLDGYSLVQSNEIQFPTALSRGFMVA